MDKRIIKTKYKIANAIDILFKKKSPYEITISELCQTAKINRNTFYSHYKDLADLYDDALNTFADMVDRRMQPFFNKDDFEGSIRAAFNYVNTETNIKNFLSLSDFRPHLLFLITTKYKNRFIEKIIKENNNLTVEEINSLGDFISGGITQITLSWFKTGMAEGVDSLVERIMIPTKLILNSYVYKK